MTDGFEMRKQAIQLVEGDLIDIEGDKFFTSTIESRYEYAEVWDAYLYEDYNAGDFGVVVETTQGTAFVPEDHIFEVISKGQNDGPE